MTFNWKEPDGITRINEKQIGFIAQDVAKVIPDWVGTDDKGFLTVNKKGLDVMLVASVGTLRRKTTNYASVSRRWKRVVVRWFPGPGGRESVLDSWP